MGWTEESVGGMLGQGGKGAGGKGGIGCVSSSLPPSLTLPLSH